RGAVILFFCISLLGGGVASLFLVPHTPVPELSNIRLDRLVCIACLLLSSAIGPIGMLLLGTGARRLGKQLRNLIETGEGSLLQSPHPDLSRLTFAVNDLIEHGQQSAARAMLKVKELEIQLKVATAEREHAQAIIYSISDAVL